MANVAPGVLREVSTIFERFHRKTAAWRLVVADQSSEDACDPTEFTAENGAEKPPEGSAFRC